jgi:hypothetical protein
LAILDATFSAEGDTTELVESTRKLFVEIAERDGRKDRSGPLALLELEKRANDHSISKGVSEIQPGPLFTLTVLLKTRRFWGTTSSYTSINSVTRLAVLRI